MLVLTRRKNQRVSFPGLGISVQIVEVRGKQVRLGVDAPNEIRIVRDELERFDDPPSTAGPLPVGAGYEEAARQLATANLAIHLAVNQLRQGKTQQAELALEEAIRNLSNLENRIQAGASGTSGLAVHEPNGEYAVSKKRNPSGLLLDAGDEQRLRLIGMLEQRGVQVNVAGNSLEAIRRVGRRGNWPEFALMAANEMDEIDTGCELLGQMGELRLQPELWVTGSDRLMVWTRNGFPAARLQDWLNAF